MSFNLTNLTQMAMATAFRLGPPLVRVGVYHRPAAFNSATGQLVSGEITAPCSFLSSAVRSSGYLGLAKVVPGTESLLVRASELAAVSSPGKGDYILENGSGLRWNVEATRLDVTEVFYVVQALRSLDEDWGDLSAATQFEDWGDLSAATEFEDRLALI